MKAPDGLHHPANCAGNRHNRRTLPNFTQTMQRLIALLGCLIG
jgi:hypothetical protein